MTEPTPDIPESELTGDGLRVTQIELSAAWATLENDVLHPGDFAPQLADLFRVGRRGVEAAYARLAALPNREAAPREGLDVERLARAMRPVKRRTEYQGGFSEQYSPPTPAEVAAEYDRLSRGSPRGTR